jgi:chromosomal replication initiation ATPase DnaA
MDSLNRNRITVQEIQKIVSDVTEIPLTEFLVKEGTKDARKEERVAARQLSMFFSRKYTGKGVTKIGELHKGRDHATVIHAIKTVYNALDTNDRRITDHYYLIEDKIKTRLFIQKNVLIKTWIKNRVPLEKRRELLCKMTA